MSVLFTQGQLIQPIMAEKFGVMVRVSPPIPATPPRSYDLITDCEYGPHYMFEGFCSENEARTFLSRLTNLCEFYGGNMTVSLDLEPQGGKPEVPPAPIQEHVPGIGPRYTVAEDYTLDDLLKLVDSRLDNNNRISMRDRIFGNDCEFAQNIISSSECKADPDTKRKALVALESLRFPAAKCTVFGFTDEQMRQFGWVRKAELGPNA